MKKNSSGSSLGHDELDGARAHVPDAAGRLGGGPAHRVPAGLVEQRGGRLLDDLLVPALQAALAFAEVDDVCRGCRRRPGSRCAGAARRTAPAAACRRRTRPWPPGGPPPIAPASSPGDRASRMPLPPPPADGLISRGNPMAGAAASRSCSVIPALAGPGDDRHPGRGDGGLGGDLVAHRLDGGGRGPDEDQARVRAGPGERGVLGQEPVTRVDGLRAGLACSVQDAPDVQVALGGRRRAEPDRLVGVADVPGAGVRVAVDRDAGDAEGPQGADDADGDLAAVGHQDRVKHGLTSGRRRRRWAPAGR